MDPFDQLSLKNEEHKYLFDKYFHIFPWNILPQNAEGFDMGVDQVDGQN